MNKKLFSLILMTALFAAVLLSCKKDDTPTFVVTFDSKGGTPTPETQMVKTGDMVRKPDNPTLTNHLFIGWTTTNDETGSLWDFAKETVIADMMLYAKWTQSRLEINGYSVTVSSDENGYASVTYEEGSYVTLTATANNGYSFAEWQVIKGDIHLYTTKSNPVMFYMPNEEVEVKAIFAPFAGLLEYIIPQDIYNRKTIWYNYDSQNRITSYNYVKSLEYNDVGDLEKYHWFEMRSGKDITFSKNDNKITFNYISYPYAAWQDIEITANGEIELNVQGLPVKMKSEFVQYHEYTNGTISITNWFYTATLTWQNGNLTKLEWESEDEQGSIVGTKTYTHDDKKTPFHHCNTPKWALWCLSNDWIYAYSVNYWHDDKYVYSGHNENNIKTETWEEDGVTITNEYTYNDDGFPVTRTWAWTMDNNKYTDSEAYTYK